MNQMGKTNRKYNYENGEETISRGRAYASVKGFKDNFELDIEAGMREYANRKSPMDIDLKSDQSDENA